jgi:outer membrane lipoprotein SlyB
MSHTEKGAIVGASVGAGLGGLALITGNSASAATLAITGTVAGAGVGSMVDISDMAKKMRDSRTVTITRKVINLATTYKVTLILNSCSFSIAHYCF